MKKVVLILGLLICSCFAFGNVESNWNKNCKKCHGEFGTGDTKIGQKLEIIDYTKVESLSGFTDEDLFNMTKDGVEKSKMKGYGNKLTDEEIQELVVYMRSFSKE